MSAATHKKSAALAALDYIKPDCRLGIGTGSTVNYLIDALAAHPHKPACVVSSSEASTASLEKNGIATTTLDAAGDLDLYIDGADEIDDNLQMIKGGGGAHTREKIIAASARQFIVIADGSKKVSRLGKFPLAVEIIPLARGYVARKLAGLGGNVAWREGFVSDNSNWILDVRGLDITDAATMEQQINQITGVVENGIFAKRCADMLIVSDNNGVHIQNK